MKRLAKVLTASLLLTLGAVVTVTFTALPAMAQHTPTQRTVSGKVQEKGGAPVKGAKVFLKDSKTNSVQSYLSAADGSYRISQLSPSGDYEIWAEADGKKSGNKPISSFDSKTDVTINLQLK